MATFFADLANSTGGGMTIVPQVISSATTTNGAAIDLGPVGPQMVSALQMVGTMTGAGNTVTTKIQESETSGGSYTDVVGATFTAVTASGYQWISWQQQYRYCRAVIVTTGTVTSAPVAVQVVFNPRLTGSGGGWTNS